MSNKWVLILVTLIFLSACSGKPEPIQYGFDACHFCEMTIVDQKHASILVSSKGKSYKFDAIECMARHFNREAGITYNYLLVADYPHQDSMIDAREATYLISEKIPSPMGANLSAFSTVTEAEKFRDSHSGNLYSWSEIKEKFQ